MKVLQLVQRPQRRGAEVFAYDLTRRFEALGIGVKTVYLYPFDGERRLPLHNGDVCLDGVENHVFERFPKFEPRLSRRVTREIHRFGPDIVQVNGSRTIKYGAASKRLSQGPVPWKLVYRNIGVPSDWHHWRGTVLIYRKMIMPMMDGVIGVSKYSLDNAKSLYRLTVPSRIIMNGISPDRMKVSTDRSEFRRSHGVADDDIVLLFVGFLDKVKRPDRFVRLVARASADDPRVRGWVLGEGPLGERTRKLARQLGIEGRIRFFGSQDDVANYMQAADLFVVTSRSEGVPAVVLEAGYMGLPVVATRIGGLPECIREGETGLLVDPDSMNELTAAVRDMVRDRDRRSVMGDNAKEWVRGSMTIDNIADRYLEFYEQVLNGHFTAKIAASS